MKGSNTMTKTFFTCIAILPNSATDLAGFRANIFGLKLKYNRRQYKNRGFKIGSGSCFNYFHFGKRTIYFEKRANRQTKRKLAHFAG